MKYFITHWKTTLCGLLVCAFTSLVATKTITVEQWIMAVGGIGTIAGVLAKDWDKVEK